MKDRIVHATYNGMDIVRYDRAGKWYLEPADSSLPRQQVTVKEAATQALWGLGHGGSVYLGHHGGTSFDRLVTAARTEQDMSGYEDGGE